MIATSSEALETWAAFRRIGARERATLTRLHALRFGRTVEDIIDLRDEQPAEPLHLLVDVSR